MSGFPSGGQVAGGRVCRTKNFALDTNMVLCVFMFGVNYWRLYLCMSENVTRCIQRLPELFSRNENPTSPIAGNRRGSVRRQKDISEEK